MKLSLSAGDISTVIQKKLDIVIIDAHENLFRSMASNAFLGGRLGGLGAGKAVFAKERERCFSAHAVGKELSGTVAHIFCPGRCVRIIRELVDHIVVIPGLRGIDPHARNVDDQQADQRHDGPDRPLDDPAGREHQIDSGPNGGGGHDASSSESPSGGARSRCTCGVRKSFSIRSASSNRWSIWKRMSGANFRLTRWAISPRR